MLRKMLNIKWWEDVNDFLICTLKKSAKPTSGVVKTVAIILHFEKYVEKYIIFFLI